MLEINKAIINKFEKVIFLKKINSFAEITKIEKATNKYAPRTPLYVLLGLIFVNLGPFKILPKTYPPISDETQIIIINIIKFVPLEILLISLNKKTE